MWERVWIRSFRPYRLWWSERAVSRVVYHLQEETGSLMTFANVKQKCLISYLSFITPKPPIYRKRPGRVRPERIFTWAFLGYSFQDVPFILIIFRSVGLTCLYIFILIKISGILESNRKLKRKPKNAIFSWREITRR